MTTHPSRLFMDEPPIAIAPGLIRVLGGHDLACFAQQVHYIAMSHDGRVAEGFRWAVRSLEEWCEAVVLTPKQARRVIATLTDMGVLVRWTPPGTYDRTAWSRINVDAIDARLSAGASGPKRRGVHAANGAMTSRQNGPDVLLQEGETTTGEFPSSADDGPQTDDVDTAPACAPTVNQRANAITRRMFDGIKEHTGKPVAGLSFMGVRGVVAKMLEAGWSDDDVIGGLRALWRENAPINAATLEAELDGRRARRRPQANKVAELAGLTFDEGGNLVGPPR